MARSSGLLAGCGSVLAACLLAIVPSDCEAQVHGRVGVGNGLAYGGVLWGAGGELEFGGRVALLGGVGVGTARSPWAFGGRLYLLPPDKRWRPHVSFLRGTEGNGLYLGTDHDLGRPGRVVLTYGLGFGAVNLEANVGATAGIGYRW